VPRKSFGSALREAREVAGLTQEELAKATGNSVSSVSAWERGTHTPSWSTVGELLDAIGMSLHDFADIVEGVQVSKGSCPTFAVDFYDGPPDSSEALPSPTMHLPLLKDGFWSKLFHQPETPGRFIWSRAVKDEMIPDFYPGDLVVIDTKAPKPRSRQLVAGYTADGEPAVRRYVREGGEEKLFPGNRHYPEESFEGFQLIGRVIAAVRFFR
jgi:transcriptional regulator with XRE-family HTH domain